MTEQRKPDIPVTVRSSATIAKAMKQPEHSSNVKVCVRVRPFSDRDRNENQDPNGLKPIVQVQNDIVSLLHRTEEGKYVEKETAFGFDKVFWSVDDSLVEAQGMSRAMQETVFDEVGYPLTEAAVSGYNVSVLAYGQTGSGKTHTMLGTHEDPGIASRFINKLFSSLRAQCEGTQALSFTVEMSFMEIYNEQVRDLLLMTSVGPNSFAAAGEGSTNEPVDLSGVNNASVASFDVSPSGSPDRALKRHFSDLSNFSVCKVRNHPQYGPFVEGLSRITLNEPDECIELMRAGVENRATASTSMNATSSRSHAVFQLCIRQRDVIRGTEKLSLVNLVDLAGSERVKLSKVTGKAFTEATKINLSLSTLRRVIDVLLENSSKGPKETLMKPPYRDSTLTWLLSDTLGGNSKTVMISTVSPFYGNYEDTHNTLIYAQKAKAIVCHVRVNEERSEVVLAEIKKEMDKMRRKLSVHKKGDPRTMEEHTRLNADLETAQRALNVANAEAEVAARKRKNIMESIRKHEDQLSEIAEKMSGKMDVYHEQQKVHQELTEVLDTRKVTQEQIEEELIMKQNRAIQITNEMKRRNSLFIRKEMKKRHARNAAKALTAVNQQGLAEVFRTATELKKNREGLAKMNTAIAEVRERQKLLDEQNEALQTKIKVQISENNHEQIAADEKQGEFDRLSTEVGDVVENKTNRLKFLIEGRKKAIAGKNDAKAEILFVESELEEVKKQAAVSTMAEIEVVTAQIEKVKENLKAVDQELKSVEADHNVFSNKVKCGEDELDDFRGQIAKLKKASDETTQAEEDELPDVQDLELFVRELEAAAAEDDIELAQTEDQIAKLEDEIAMMKRWQNETETFASLRTYGSPDGSNRGRSISSTLSPSSASPAQRSASNAGTTYRSLSPNLQQQQQQRTPPTPGRTRFSGRPAPTKTAY